MTPDVRACIQANISRQTDESKVYKINDVQENHHCDHLQIETNHPFSPPTASYSGSATVHCKLATRYSGDPVLFYLFLIFY